MAESKWLWATTPRGKIAHLWEFTERRRSVSACCGLGSFEPDLDIQEEPEHKCKTCALRNQRRTVDSKKG